MTTIQNTSFKTGGIRNLAYLTTFRFESKVTSYANSVLDVSYRLTLDIQIFGHEYRLTISNSYSSSFQWYKKDRKIITYISLFT